MLKPVDPDVLRSKVAMLLELQRKSAELRASEERFRAAFEGAPIGMGLSTVEGRWLEVNGALCELLGRSAADLLWDPAAARARRRERAALTHPGQAEVRCTRSRTLSRWRLDAQGQPLNHIWQVVDVTEQRRAAAERAARAEAEAVAEAMEKLQRVTEAALEHLELRELLDALVGRIREAFAADLARILLVDPRTSRSCTWARRAGSRPAGRVPRRTSSSAECWSACSPRAGR